MNPAPYLDPATSRALLAAQLHTALLDAAVLRARARNTAIAAVIAGWWDHRYAGICLTSCGLPDLPMMWPIEAEIPIRLDHFDTDAERAVAHARTTITSLLGTVLGDDGRLLHLTVDAAAIDTTRPPEPDGHFYRLDTTVVLSVAVKAIRESDAKKTSRQLVSARLQSIRDLHPDLAAATYRLPAEFDPFDLQEADLDPIADSLDDPALAGLLTLTHGGTSVLLSDDPELLAPLQRHADEATAALAKLRRDLRRQVIDALAQCWIGVEPDHDGYHYADQILQAMGLAPLPRSWQYTATANITLAVAADSPDSAQAVAYQQLRDISPATPQRKLPIAHPEPFVAPVVTETGPGRYRVDWPMSYLVCLRGTDCQVLAEAAARAQLSTFDTAYASLPIQITSHGLRVDRLLDPEND